MKNVTTHGISRRRQFLKKGLYTAPGIVALGYLMPIRLHGAGSDMRVNVDLAAAEPPRTQSTAGGSTTPGTGAEEGKPNLENTTQTTGTAFSDNSGAGIETTPKKDEEETVR